MSTSGDRAQQLQSAASLLANRRGALEAGRFRSACEQNWLSDEDLQKIDMTVDRETEIPVRDAVTLMPIAQNDIVLLSDGNCYAKSSIVQLVQRGVVDARTGRTKLPLTRAPMTDSDYVAVGQPVPNLESDVTRQAINRTRIASEMPLNAIFLQIARQREAARQRAVSQLQDMYEAYRRQPFDRAPIVEFARVAGQRIDTEMLRTLLENAESSRHRRCEIVNAFMHEGRTRTVHLFTESEANAIFQVLREYNVEDLLDCINPGQDHYRSRGTVMRTASFIAQIWEEDRDVQDLVYDDRRWAAWVILAATKLGLPFVIQRMATIMPMVDMNEIFHPHSRYTLAPWESYLNTRLDADELMYLIENVLDTPGSPMRNNVFLVEFFENFVRTADAEQYEDFVRELWWSYRDMWTLYAGPDDGELQENTAKAVYKLLSFGRRDRLTPRKSVLFDWIQRDNSKENAAQIYLYLLDEMEDDEDSNSIAYGIAARAIEKFVSEQPDVPPFLFLKQKLQNVLEARPVPQQAKRQRRE